MSLSDQDNGVALLDAIRTISEEGKTEHSRLIDNKVDEEFTLPVDATKPAAAKAPRTAEERSNSFEFVKGYAYRECSSISIGIVFLIGGSLSDLTVPLFVGKTIDLLNKEDYDGIGKLCLYMALIILVSYPYLICGCN